MKNKKVIISAKELAQLLTVNNTLIALESGGVDNWEWYGQSLRDFEKEFGDIDVDADQVIEKYQELK